MLKNMTKAERCVNTEYYYDFEYEYNASGFRFPCSREGHIYIEDLTEDGYHNLMHCLSHIDDFVWHGIREVETVYTEPAKGECSCGNLVELWNQYHGACQCERCGRWYNLFGQELIPPEYWEDDDENYYDDF